MSGTEEGKSWVSRRCHNTCETHRANAAGRQRISITQAGRNPQVRKAFRLSGRDNGRTRADPSKRAECASGAEGRRFESCHGHSLTSANKSSRKICATNR